MKYQFIDIGCGHQSVSTDIFGTSDEVFGIYVEPIKQYLDVLPEGKNIIKENCAIYDSIGEIEFNAIIKNNPRYFSNKEISAIVQDPNRLNDYISKYGNSGQSSFLDLGSKLPTQKIKVKINGKIYSSFSSAARDLNCCHTTIRNRLNKPEKYPNYKII